MREFVNEMSAVAREFSAKEWAAIVAGVVIFASYYRAYVEAYTE